MKYLIPLLICSAAVHTANALDPPSKTSPGEAVATSNAPGVALGTNTNLKVCAADRERIRAFYRDILGCEMTKASEGSIYSKLATAFSSGS